MKREFEWGRRTYVMGIVNVAPDSFSGDGVTDVEAAVEQGLRFVDEGADILDVGGESTRPGSARVEPEQELRRVIPVIEGLAARTNAPISVDTSRAVVARHAIQAGVTIVNDVWALTRDAELGYVAAAHDVYLVLMHNRDAQAVVGELGGHYGNVEYESRDIVQAVATELAQRVEVAERAGISRSNIIIDPGIGFGKGLEQNLELLRRLSDLRTILGLADLPLLLGTSRKSVIGLTLNLPVQERLEGTLATLALGIAQGVDIVRVHDVRAAVRVCRMTDAVVRRGQETRDARLGLW
ncbi:MAG: dihydropteroate synthase [Anaerolineae bacterium]|nr:dihydropteroate synthase [Anaerolineae bacterium]